MSDPARVRVAVDAMGGDAAPRAEVEAALAAIADPSVDIVLVRDEARVRVALDELGAPAGRIQIRHAPEVIGMDDSPASAIRQKKGSSMRVCFDLARQGEV